MLTNVLYFIAVLLNSHELLSLMEFIESDVPSMQVQVTDPQFKHHHHKPQYT